MCGIAGTLSAKVRDPQLLAMTAQRMAGALRHRGPDDEGVWVDPTRGVALGHRRLAVIDLSPLGKQPMQSRSGRYVLAYNGEIYNFRLLRAQLEMTGGEFRGHSDTEVILASVDRWGLDAAVQKFNGMFAFAIWDRSERMLTLARDRFGEKPLYYGWADDSFVFASELVGLRRHPAFQGEIDRDALAHYMQRGYIPAPRSIYRGIYKLLPGSLLRITLDNALQHVAPVPYWSAVDKMLTASTNRFVGSTEDAIEQLDERLVTAVALRLESDVPLGAFLSGGIDSSTVVAMMQRARNAPVNTYTIGFEERNYDEAIAAGVVAKYLGTRHTELRVSAADSMDVIPRLPVIYDEPFADSSQIPTCLIASLARSEVTVSLTGDGGDEILGGYNRYLLSSGLPAALLRQPLTVRRTIGQALRALAPGTWDRLGALGATLGARIPRHLGDKIHRFSRTLDSGSMRPPYKAFMTVWGDAASLVLGANAEPEPELPPNADTLDSAHYMMLLDTITYLPDDILVKVDRASMAVSLETRVPFLDHEVAEFCWTLPLELKMKNGSLKWLLRRVLDRYVPNALVDRPKTGFAVPIGDWLRGPMKDWAAALLDPSRIAREAFLDPNQVEEVWTRHLSSRENCQDKLWAVLMFQAWLDAEKSSKAAAA
jgi:asparagine synthase (glutamine-hydrolysing)